MASAWLEQQGLKPTKGPAIKGETIAEVKGTDYGDGVLPNKLNLVNFIPNPIKLEPVIEQEKASNKSINPIFAYILTTLAILGFVLTVGYFFFIKKRTPDETPQTTTTPTEQTENKNQSDQTAETKTD